MTKIGVPPKEEVEVEIKRQTKTDKKRTDNKRKVTKEKGRETLESTTNKKIKEAIIVQAITIMGLKTQIKTIKTTIKIITTINHLHITKMKDTMTTKSR